MRNHVRLHYTVLDEVIRLDHRKAAAVIKHHKLVLSSGTTSTDCDDK
jgi:hypothetical protein